MTNQLELNEQNLNAYYFARRIHFFVVMGIEFWFFFYDCRSEEKKSYLSVKLLPKKPARILRNTLQNLYERIYLTHWSERGKRDVSDSDEALEKTFKIKNKEVTLSMAKYAGPRNFRRSLRKWK